MKLLPILIVLCLLCQLIPFTETSSDKGKGKEKDDGKKGKEKKGGTLKRVKAASAEAFKRVSNKFKSDSAGPSKSQKVHPEAGPSASSGTRVAQLKRSSTSLGRESAVVPLSRKSSSGSSASSSSSSAGSLKDHTGLRVLMVAPNQYKSHYALNKRLALLLLEQTDWVEEVYVIIPNREGLLRDQEFEEHPEIGKRLHIEYFYTGMRGRAVFNDDFKTKHGSPGSSKGESSKGSGGFSGFGSSQGSSSKGGSGTAHQQGHGSAVLKKRDGTPYTPEEAKKYAENLRKFDAKINTAVEDDGPMEAWSKRNPKILLGTNQPFMLGLSSNIELVKAMRLRNFDVGMADVWDYAVFHFLYFSKVKNIVATSAQPIQSVYYDFMHFSDEMKHNPELWTATKKEANFDSRETGGHIPPGKTDDNFAAQHKKSIVFAKDYFHWLNVKAGKICKDHHYADTCKSYEQLFDNAKYFFVNTQQQLDFRPTRNWPSKIVFFGGITLPQGTGVNGNGRRTYGIKVKKGLVVVSFGTLIKIGTMDKEIFECFLAAFKRHQDYEFFWKVDKVKKPGVGLDAATKQRLEQMETAGNIRPVDWFNQMDLLANERTTLFISHCGLNSVLEAAFQGTPLLCIPLTADQFYNAFAMQWRQTAVVVDKDPLVDKGKTLAQKLTYFQGKLNEALDETKHKHLKARMVKLKTELSNLNPTKTFLDKMRTFWHT